jgi:hypothetical protein
MNEFVALRNQYLPKNIKTIFVFESPPAHNGYFYDPSGKSSELLYRSIMKALFDEVPEIKSVGLKMFQDRGFILINPIYEPVNKLSEKLANKKILDNYEEFVQDLLNIIGQKKDTKIILVKANICRLLEGKLLESGFNVINNGVIIPFPMHYHFNSFKDKVLGLV